MIRRGASNRESDLSGQTVVEECTMLKHISADQRKETLGRQCSTDSIGGFNRDRQSYDFDLNWIDVLRSRRMGCRSNIDNIYNGQLELLGRLVIDASRGCDLPRDFRT